MYNFLKKSVPKNVQRFIINTLGFHPVRNNIFIGVIHTLLYGVYRTGGCEFCFPKKAVSISFRSRFFYDVYEKSERDLLVKHVNKHGSVLELGACIGVVSVLTNKLLADPTRHVVVEANPELIPWLNRNRENNGARFLIEHCLVGRGSRTDFFIDKMIVGGSADRETTRKTEVVVRSLDELFAKHGSFDALIMDIEGGEYNVIRENIQNLKSFRMIIMENHPGILGESRVVELKEILSDSGFKIIDSIETVDVWQKR